jgi:hypothetical protein
MTENDFNFVDTSNASFNSQFKPVTDDFYGEDNDMFADEDAAEQGQQQEENQDYNWQNLDDNNQSPESTGNDVLDTYIEWANEKGIDVSTQNIDPRSFDQEEMDKLVGKYYIGKHLNNVDPRITELADNGIDLDQYIDQKNYYNNLINTDPVQLYKAQMYDYIKNAEANMGTISLDQNGNPNEDSVKYLINEVERRIVNMREQDIVQKGKQIQQHYAEQLNALPKHLVEQQRNKYNQELSKYNNEVEELTSIYKEKLSKADNLIVDFSGQAEKDDFINYMKQGLQMANYEGQPVVPLLHRLQNDADFLATTMRLLHMHEKGYFTDLRNKERNAAFKSLSVTPVLGKNNKSKQNGGAGAYRDTSDPSYQKQFKR